MYKDEIAWADIDSQTEQVYILLLTVSFNRIFLKIIFNKQPLTTS